jgi:hypothetical protein
MTLSDKCHERSFQYVVVLNGVWHGLDATMGSSGALFEIDRQNLQPPLPKARLETATKRRSFCVRSKPLPAVAASPGTVDGADPAAQSLGGNQAEPERQASAAKLFHRDSADPLRAGHPDLWNLLVTGTCLEGSPYKRW